MFGTYPLYRYICDIANILFHINIKNSLLTMKTVQYCIYVFLFTFSLILTLDHLTAFISYRDVSNEFIHALIIGLCVTLAMTYLRVKSGKKDERLVNLKKYKYWAFAELSLFFAVLPLGAIHMFDPDAAYMVSEIIFAIFFGLFCGSMSVLYLIRRK